MSDLVGSDSFPSQPLAELLAEVDAAVARMTPAVWYDHHRQLEPQAVGVAGPYTAIYTVAATDIVPPETFDQALANAAGIVALRNAWPRVSRALDLAEHARQVFEDQLNDKLIDLRRVEAENAQLRATLAEKTCSGEWPCEASTTAASLELERNDLRATLARALTYLTCICPPDDGDPGIPRIDHYPDCIIAEARRVLGERS